MVRWQIAAVLGLAASVAITGAALLGGAGRIEADVVAKAKDVLAGEVLSWAVVSTDGRELRLEGTAPTEELRNLAIDRLDRVFGVRTVDTSAVGLLPEVKPYRVVLTRDNYGLSIAGQAPSQPDRQRMVAALTTSIPDLAYNDRLQLARGIPDDRYLKAVSQLVPLLTHLEQGEIMLSNHDVTITGQTVSNAGYEILKSGRFGLPDGYRVTKVDITRPLVSPFIWSAENDGRKIMISGHAPDRNSQLKLFGILVGNKSGLRVVDTVDLGSGEPKDFVTTAAQAADYLDLLSYGRMDISDGIVSINGRASSPEAYRTLTSFLSIWQPTGYRLQASVDLPMIAPYTLTASRNDTSLTVSGFAPSEELEAKIAGSAEKLAGLKGAVIETTLGDGAPEGFEQAAAFGFELLAHVKNGSFLLTDNDLTVTGTAVDGSDLLEVDALMAANRPEGFRLDVSIKPPVASPFLWTMERSANGIQITGSSTSETTRAAIRELADQIDADLGVSDRTSLASGLPENVSLKDIAEFAAAQLSMLSEGTVLLSDTTLSVFGTASSAKDGMAVVAALDGKLPRGLAKGLVQINFPLAFGLRIERGLDVITLEGTVSDDAMRNSLLAAANRSFGAAEIVDNLEAVEGLPADAEEAALVAIKAASLMATGVVSIEGTVMTVQGKAFTGMGAVRLPSELAALVPNGYRLDTAVGVAPTGPIIDSAACDSELTALMSKNAVYFQSGSADISGDSHGLLDRIGALVMRCPSSRISIEGHTDSDGDAAANQALSEQRSDAVKAYLAELGVAVDRLSSAGFGATKPVADNATEEGKARNRRIEFHAVDGSP